MDDEQILYILEQHNFDTSLDWRDPEIGFSPDELLAMAIWEAPEYQQQAEDFQTTYYAADLHTNRIPDWMNHAEHHPA